MDPLASSFPWQSPYCAMDNDPINKIDPDGRAASPIYDYETGKYLGNDDQGFKGEVLFMSSNAYNFLSFGGAGTISHTTAKSFSSTINQVLESPTQQKVNAVSNAINDVVSKTDNLGIEMSSLHNGKISTYYYEGNSQGGVDAFNNNDGHGIGVKVPASTSPTADAKGQKTMTFNLRPSSLIARTTDGKVQGTVENIQNTAVHEGTHVKGVTGQGKGHSKSYEVQMNHPTFKNVTPEFKKEIIDVYKDIKAGRL